ncbi:MAG: hypothetical protein V1775_02145 [Bacteroidota bacterium]
MSTVLKVIKNSRFINKQDYRLEYIIISVVKCICHVPSRLTWQQVVKRKH